MDMATVWTAIQAWPAEAQFELVERIWDRFEARGWYPDLSDEMKAELDRRLAAADANPDDVYTREEVEEHLNRLRTPHADQPGA